MSARSGPFTNWLGSLEAAVERVEMAWPSGAKEELRSLPANHLYVVQEGQGIVSRRSFS
jgi:hypothetical protein